MLKMRVTEAERGERAVDMGDLGPNYLVMSKLSARVQGRKKTGLQREGNVIRFENRVDVGQCKSEPYWSQEDRKSERDEMMYKVEAASEEEEEGRRQLPALAYVTLHVPKTRRHPSLSRIKMVKIAKDVSS